MMGGTHTAIIPASAAGPVLQGFAAVADARDGVSGR
jgi:hypothetical protein